MEPADRERVTGKPEVIPREGPTTRMLGGDVLYAAVFIGSKAKKQRLTPGYPTDAAVRSMPVLVVFEVLLVGGRNRHLVVQLELGGGARRAEILRTAFQSVR